MQLCPIATLYKCKAVQAHAGVTSCPQSSATQVAAFQQLLAQEQALGMLCSAVDKAREGKHQYLSGTLHNVAKALANAQPQPDMQEALLAAGYGSSKLKAVIRRSCISASLLTGQCGHGPSNCQALLKGSVSVFPGMMYRSLSTVHHSTSCAHDVTCHTRGFSE